MENTNNKENYEKFPYKSKSFVQSQPFRMKLITSFLGFKTQDLEKARILEIGCSFGGNIIPYALFYENSEVYGIDLSEIQINKGKEIVEKLQLDNCRLHQMDILKYNQEFGKFDYIICHGVFSWVKDEIKEKILNVIKNSLKENGVAHISYNTYPGWKYLDVYKDAGLIRKKYLEKRGLKLEAEDVVNFGKGMYQFIKENTKLHPKTIKNADVILNAEPYYVYHEYFEETNDPIYLYDFNEMLKKEGLHHISDSNIRLSLIPAKHVEKLNAECGKDFVAKEQYMDFLNNTQFRNSIITHIENVEKIKRVSDLTYNDFNEFYIRKKFASKTKETKYEKILSENYPRYIKIKELLETEDIDRDELILSLLTNDVDIEEKNIYKELKGNLKLKEKYRRYFEYFLSEKDSPIGLSFKKGESVKVLDEEKELILKFDGENSFEDILKHLKNEDLLGNIALNESDVQNVDEQLEQCLNNIINFGKFYEIFE